MFCHMFGDLISKRVNINSMFGLLLSIQRVDDLFEVIFTFPEYVNYNT